VLLAGRKLVHRGRLMELLRLCHRGLTMRHHVIELGPSTGLSARATPTKLNITKPATAAARCMSHSLIDGAGDIRRSAGSV
jgi:hypothetical protein